MGYSSVEDMLIGDVRSNILDKQAFVEDAAREIDSKIGRIYQVPLNLSQLEQYAVLTIKRLNNHIASGRFLMAANAGDESIHAYGRMLVREAYQELDLIASGSIQLDGAPLRPGLTDTTGPTISHQDQVSSLDAFYEPVMGGRQMALWEPGAMP